MPRPFLTGLLALALVLSGLLTLHPAFLALALPLLAYLLAGLWRAPQAPAIEASRRLQVTRLPADTDVKIELTVTNIGPDLEEALIEDILPPGLTVVDGSAAHLVSLASGQSAAWTYTLRGKRGYYVLKEVRLTAREHFGLVAAQQVCPTDDQLFILPPVMRLRRVVIAPRRTRVYSGTIPARQGGAGVEFFGVREYQLGDSPRRINWRLTARHPSSTYTNQFEQERVADVGIILDGRKHTNEFASGRSLFEHAVLATAALADSLLAAGNRVGLLFFGENATWTTPGYGKLQRERILHDLAHATPGDVLAFSELIIPKHLFPPHSQLVLVSPLDAEDIEPLTEVRARGYNLLVVSPDPVGFELAGLPQRASVSLAGRVVKMQRQILLGKLRHVGIQVVEWDISQPFVQAARRGLESPPAWLRAISDRGRRA
jgi:uncharacterized protein (DUF58 family)